MKKLLVALLILFILFLLFVAYVLGYLNVAIGTLSTGARRVDVPVRVNHHVVDNFIERSYMIDDKNGIIIYLKNGRVSYKVDGGETVNIGLRAGINIGSDDIFYQAPYLTIVLDNDQVYIYNTENKKDNVFTVKVCPKAHLTSAMYQDKYIFWYQSRDWSACQGGFKKKLILDF